MSESVLLLQIQALCDGLLCAPRTRLVSLDLSYTQMDHVGMAKLGAVIQAGRLTLLETLHLSRNVNLTDKAVFVLAEGSYPAGEECTATSSHADDGSSRGGDGSWGGGAANHGLSQLPPNRVD